MFIYVLIATLVAVAVAACSKLAWKRFQFCRILSRIPGPKGLPIIGNALQFKRDPHEYLNQLHGWCDKYKEGLFCIWFGPEPLIFIHSPELAQILLSSTKNINKSQFYTLMLPWLGTGLLTSSDSKWKSRRKLLTSTFHFKILDSFMPVIRRHTNTMVESLKSHCGKGKFDISSFIKMCTLDTICETAMGIDIMAQNDSNSKYVKAVLGLTDQMIERMKKPWLWNDMIYFLTMSGKINKTNLQIVHGFTDKTTKLKNIVYVRHGNRLCFQIYYVGDYYAKRLSGLIIDDRINERKEMKSSNTSGKSEIFTSSKRKLLAFLDLLLEEYDAGNIDKEGIREEVDTFTFEGHDTVSATLLWIIHMIGKHPEVQTKLQDEADSLYESAGDVVTMADLKELDFTECVIKEVMRLLPPVPLFSRVVDEECNLGPYVIPKGANYGILTKPLHCHPDHWEDPNLFKPERFLERNHDKRRHPYAYVPFSAGPRNCIGQRLAMMEIKIIISSIFHHFHVNATQETDKIRRTGDVILRSLEGFWVELTARK